MNPKLVTPPVLEGAPLQAVKSHLKITWDGEDFDLGQKFLAASAFTDEMTGYAMLTSTWDYFANYWPSGSYITLPHKNASGVTSLTYTDIDGTATVLPSDEYEVDLVSVPPRVVLKRGNRWPQVELKTTNPIVVRYVAGWGAEITDIPHQLWIALLILTGELYTNREASVTGPALLNARFPFGYWQFITPWLY